MIICMIQKEGHDITGITAKERVIAFVYKAGRHVWQAIRSCFGAGFWVNEKPWLNDEAWRN